MADGDFDLLQAQRRIFLSSLGAHAKFVGLAICDHWSRQQNEPFPSVARLVRWTGHGRDTVMRAVAELRAAGAINVVETKGRVHRYDLTPLMRLPVDDSDQSTTATSRQEPPDQSTTATGPVAHVDTKEPKKEPTKEPSESAHGEAPETAAPSAEPKRPGTKRSKRAKAPEVPLPIDWTPSDAHRAYATKHGLDVEIVADAMRGWAEGRTTPSWNGTFSTWLANRVRWNREDAKRGRAPVQQGGTIRETKVF